MNLTAFSIKHNVAVVVLCIGLVAIGLFSYFTMSRESFPDVEFPYVIVTTVLDGANPTDIEQSVTVPLETELDGVEGLKEMRSASLDSLSMISLEFHPDVNKEAALRRVRDAVDQAKPDVSSEADEPIVKELSVSSFPVVIYHLVSTSGSISLSELDDLAEKVEDEIKTVSGVLDVDVFGSRDREILIEVDPERLHFYHLSLAQVQAILRGTNRNVSAGAADGRKNRIVMRVPGEFRNPAEIFNLVISSTPQGTPVYMRDVASVRYAFEDEESRARLYDFTVGGEGKGNETWVQPYPSISLQVTKRTGANVLDMCRSIDEKLDQLPLPDTIRVVKGLDMSKDVESMVADLENGIGTSLILVLAVIFVGLGAMNAVLVAAAIPFSMLLSIVILKSTGETLNMMVLFALLLSLGMLVDNAIVIIENIYRHYSLGLSRTKAAIVGTQEVMWPVITSTATTVGAFFPLLFWPGIMGQFMSFLPRTVIIVLICSLFVALVINPTLAAMTMHIKPGAHTTIDPESHRPTYWLVRRYQPLLEFLLNNRKWTLVTSVCMLVFVIVLYGAFGAGVELFPPTDPDNVNCSITPPEGISLEASDQLCKNMEARVFGKPGSGFDEPVANLKHASVVVGLAGVGGAGTGGGLQSGNSGPVKVQVEFVDREFRTEPTTETLKKMRLRLDGLTADGRRVAPPLFGADYDVITPQEGPPTGSPVSVDVFGDDLNEMTRVIGDMKRLISATAGTVKPTDDAVTAQPTIEWHVDRARAGMHQLDQATIASILQIAVGGMQTGTFGHGDDEQDILLRLPPEYRFDLDRLENLTIPMVNGQAVPVTSTANARLVPGPVTIKHVDKRRVLNASADVQPGIRQDSSIRKAFQERVKNYSFPPGVTYQFGGAAEEEQSAKQFLGKAFVVAIFIILMVLVLQFNSVAVSGIVLCSVILSLMGVFVGLLLLHAPFGIIMTGIGVISLAGVVVNNAIVLLDAIAQFEQRGQTAYEATVSACMVRFRPVLLTAITTILGLVPMALKLNWDFREMAWQFNTKSSQWWQSMSLTVIFGLLVATILTLGIVPSLYMEYATHRDRLLARKGEAD
jgi:multidrug efflux pump subunit AcrB